MPPCLSWRSGLAKGPFRVVLFYRPHRTSSYDLDARNGGVGDPPIPHAHTTITSTSLRYHGTDPHHGTIQGRHAATSAIGIEISENFLKFPSEISESFRNFGPIFQSRKLRFPSLCVYVSRCESIEVGFHLISGWISLVPIMVQLYSCRL